ncbi:hypothetical protein A1O3_05588 [Capronia epimyces CBS 606.96]|uniref:J domain-containing protein n=1 Tax=Capronia epimyces CBS 606.96 TaxID=1182542 RepID=W9XXG9_9EURO|nr:uncharacterized protein A1O3_05588 [Capronia epimyces CBS 606.96]EXJ84913.1 hypothetical protein A1O3_05588 [Capronia epimyces CBS 606.96]
MQYSLLRKANLATAYGTWQCCACTCSSSPRKRLKPNPQFAPQSRNYADVKSGSHHEYRDSMNWPCRRTTSWTPSPYEIFDLAKDAVYTKHKFYELVKIYHPDRNGTGSSGGIGHGERLERYRLVVQAHEILSDPVKRRAYDASGFGWGSTGAATRHSRGFTNGQGKTYGFGPDDDSSIFQNATWEDWERWRQRHDHPNKQESSGTYIHTNTFASLVILLAVISGVFQATRAGQFSGQLEEKAKAFSEETSRFLASRAEQYQENQLDVDGRIKHFLAKRDPSKYGLKNEETEVYRTHFAEQNNMRPMPNLKGSETE